LTTENKKILPLKNIPFFILRRMNAMKMAEKVSYIVWNLDEFYTGTAKPGRNIKDNAKKSAARRMKNSNDSKNWGFLSELDGEIFDKKKREILLSSLSRAEKEIMPKKESLDALDELVGTYQKRNMNYLRSNCNRFNKCLLCNEEGIPKKNWNAHKCEGKNKIIKEVEETEIISKKFILPQIDISCGYCRKNFKLSKEKLQEAEKCAKLLISQKEVPETTSLAVVCPCCSKTINLYDDAAELRFEMIREQEERNEFYKIKIPLSADKKFRCPDCDIKTKLTAADIIHGKAVIQSHIEDKIINPSLQGGLVVKCLRHDHYSSYYTDCDGIPVSRKNYSI
jgi:hypothetical protein